MTLSRVPSPQETSPTVHHRRGLGGWRGPITGVLAALVVVLAGLGGYALGHSGDSASAWLNSRSASSARPIFP